MRLLITGFEPAIGVTKTPSGELAKLWASEKLVADTTLEVRSIVLPQVYGQCVRAACTEIDSFSPDAVVMYGAVPSNDLVRIERFAVNADYTAIGDNTGVPVRDRPIVKGGPAAYETTLPYMELLEALDSAGVRSRLSYHAGTHTCNEEMYGVLHYLATTGRSSVPAGFIHVPFPAEFGHGVLEDEAGVMRWPEIRKASVVIAAALLEIVGAKARPAA